MVVGGAEGLERLLKVTVLAIERGKVSLGFEIDRGVPIHRWELWERIQASDQPDRPTADPVAPVG